MSHRAVPTLICFFGPPPWYLEFALESAKRFNNEVLLLGDAANSGCWSDHWDSGCVNLPKFDEFKRWYRKMSDYPDFYEMSFWRRPFVVEEWMRREGVDRAFLLDGDVLTFADYSDEVAPALPPNCAAALMTLRDQEEFEWATSLHFSYWTVAALESFTSFLIESYRDDAIRKRLEAKYQWHLRNSRPGGICEMTSLYLWLERHEKHTWNLAKVWNGMAGDLAVGTSANYFAGEYHMRRGLKHLTFENGLPHAYNSILGMKVRLLSVHCQGDSKNVMPFLYKRRWRSVYSDVYSLQRVLSSRIAGARLIASRVTPGFIKEAYRQLASRDGS